MADKNFKIKTGLDLPAPLPAAQGGTGQTSLANAINALLPDQTDNASKILGTNGSTLAWTNPGASYSDGAPANPAVGQIWVESDSSSDSFDPNIIRRKTFTATAAQTVFTTDLEFIQGYEQVFFNGMLLIRNSDYTTASNTNVTLAAGAAAGDIVEVVSITNLNSINAATTTSNTFTGRQTVTGGDGNINIEASGIIRAKNGYRITGDNGANEYQIGPFYNFTDFQITHSTNNFAAHTPRLTINSSGNVGIETGSPTEKLHVTGGNILTDPNSRRIGYWESDTVHDGYMIPYNASGFTELVNSFISGGLLFKIGQSKTEAMRITSDGNLGIGTTSPGYKVDIQNSTASNWYGLRLLSAAPVTSAFSGISLEKGSGYGGIVAGYLHQSTGSGLQILTNNGGTVVEVARAISNGSSFLIGYTTTNNTAYKLQVNSQIFATSSSIATSDGRYKENVNTITSGLNIVDSLRPVSFTWKDHPVHNFVAGKTVGFIAQEVQEALSEYDWVDNIIKTNTSDAILDEQGNEVTPSEEFLGIAESNIIPLLVAAVKELKARVETLEANNV